MAIPICSLAAATCRSAPAISGLRSSSSDGNPQRHRRRSCGQCDGRNREFRGCFAGQDAMPCSSAARSTPRSINCDCTKYSCASAWATSRSDAIPAENRFA